MLAELASTVTLLGGVKDLAGALINERDSQKAAALKIDLTEKVINAQAQLLQVHSAVIEKDGLVQTLTERIRKLEADKAERDRYKLAVLGTEGQFLAYRLREPAELAERADEPPHFLCQTCFDIESKKSVLIHNGDGHWRCHACGKGVQASPRRPLPPINYGRSNYF